MRHLFLNPFVKRVNKATFPPVITVKSNLCGRNLLNIFLKLLGVTSATYFSWLRWKVYHLSTTVSPFCRVNITCIAFALFGILTFLMNSPIVSLEKLTTQFSTLYENILFYYSVLQVLLTHSVPVKMIFYSQKPD